MIREWLTTTWLRLKTLFRRKQLERDLEDELAFHFAQRGETSQTRTRFGSEAFYKEQTRELWTFPALESFVQDIRFAIRQLVKQRGSTVVAILTLALGIGASTAIFSVIDAAMLRPLPYPDPEQLVEVGVEEMRAEGVGRPTPSMDDMRLWESADDVFTSVAGWDFAFRGRIVEGPEPERIRVLEFTEHYLPMHGVTPVLGRGFTLEDTEPGSPAVVLLGYGYWISRYEGREDVVGESIRLDDGVAIIVGVLPQSFRTDIPLFRPLRIPPEERARRGTGRVNVYGRLRPGITIEQAREWLSVRMAGLSLRDGTVEVRTTIDSLLARTVSGYETTVSVLVGAIGLILVLACVNVAGLLLARGAVRQSELAVRASIGAGPGRLIRQLLTESLVLALAGGVVGVGLAWLALDAIVANIPMSMPPNSPVEVNLRVLIATAALLIPTAMLFGLAPALRLSRARIRSGLAQSGRQVGSALSWRGSQLLVSTEIALAVILVAGAGLMIRTVMRLSAVDLGFNPEGLLTMEVLPLSKDPNVHRTYYSRLVQQLDEMPGVASAGAVNYFPLGGGTSFLSITVEGEQKGTTAFGVVPGYFETIGATLRDGRLPTHQELASGQCGVVVNSFAARELFGGRPPVGRQLGLPNAESCTVVGVIADIRHGGPLGEPVASQIYLPYEPDQHRWMAAMIVVLRPAGPMAGVEKELRRHAESIGPPVLIERIRSADDWFGDRMVTPRRRTILLGLLGGLGLVLALVGVFGMTSYAVARRTAEIGVRMAFGAESYQVVRKMLWDAAVPIVVGTIVGLLGALAATRVIVWLATPAPAQISGTVIRTESVLLEVEVKVTDRGGKPVEGLTKEDFSVFEDGQAQKVSVFEYVPRIGGNLGNLERVGQPAQEEPPATVAPVQPHTWIYIATHAGPEERDQVRKAIREFVEEQLRPGLAVSLNGRPFVADKTLLLAMLDGKATGPDGRSTPLDDVQSGTSYSEQFDAVDDGTMEGGQELGEPGLVDIAGERRTQTARVALYRYIDLIRQMGALRGKKAVVLFSRGLRVSPTEDDIADLLRRLSAEATRHRVSYYTADARRLQVPIWGGDSTYSAATSGDIGPPPANLRDIQVSQFGISTVAELTGGKAVINTNDLGEIFDKVEEDLSGYYVVGYYPSDKTGEGHQRKIRVEVNRPKVKLSYRKSYYEDLDFTHMSKSQRRRLLERVVLSETSYTDLFLETAFHFQRGGDGTPVLAYNSAIQPSLTWSLPEGGSRDLHYTFVASVRDASGRGKPLFDGLTLKRTFTPEEWELLRSDPASLLQFPSEIKLAPGEYIWKGVVRDEQTGRVGTYRSRLVVPDFQEETSPSSLLLTRQVVPRELARPRKRGATTSESAGAVPFGSQSFLLSPENAFPNGSPLFVLYDLYNVPAGQLAEPPVPRVFLVREGQVLEQPPFRGFEAEPSPERHEIRYVMVLDTADLAPSEYTLVVSLPGREDGIHKEFTLFRRNSSEEQFGWMTKRSADKRASAGRVARERFSMQPVEARRAALLGTLMLRRGRSKG